MNNFEQINPGFNSVFKAHELSIGLVVPIENYASSAIPSLSDHLERVKLIEKLGFSSLWLRDIPFHVPSFGDAGQTFDPFSYLGFLAGQTTKIALGISSIALPLHLPIHVAKSAATVDQLSKGRLILGVASGDRYQEYPALGIAYEKRGKRFREAFSYLREAQQPFPTLRTENFGELDGDMDILPKAYAKKIPMLITGFSQQSLAYNAEVGDGWMHYPRDVVQQESLIQQWRGLIPTTQKYSKPFMQPLYLDLHADDDYRPRTIPLGLKTGINYLIEYLENRRAIGVNHIALNLRFNSAPIEASLEKLANTVIPIFNPSNKETISS